MDYFVEQAPTDQEVHAIIRKKYGDRARVMARKEIRTGGVLGLFQRTAVEVTGYCTHAPMKTVNRGTAAEERSKILEQVRGRESSGEAQDSSVVDGKNAGSFESVLSEIRALRDSISTRGDDGTHREPVALEQMRQVLEENDFSAGSFPGLWYRGSNPGRTFRFRTGERSSGAVDQGNHLDLSLDGAAPFSARIRAGGTDRRGEDHYHSQAGSYVRCRCGPRIRCADTDD